MLLWAVPKNVAFHVASEATSVNELGWGAVYAGWFESRSLSIAIGPVSVSIAVTTALISLRPAVVGRRTCFGEESRNHLRIRNVGYNWKGCGRVWILAFRTIIEIGCGSFEELSERGGVLVRSSAFVESHTPGYALKNTAIAFEE